MNKQSSLFSNSIFHNSRKSYREK